MVIIHVLGDFGLEALIPKDIDLYGHWSHEELIPRGIDPHGFQLGWFILVWNPLGSMPTQLL